MRIYILSLFLLSVPTVIKAQFFKNSGYAVEMGGDVGGGEHSPFWFNANKHGVSTINKNSGYLRAALHRPFDLEKDFTYSWGVDLLGGVQYNSAFYLQQIYFSLKYKPLVLEIGSIEREPELRNPWLSSGSLTLSNNAHPIPQVRVGLPAYWTVPFTGNWFHIKGHIAYGMYFDNRFQEDFTNNGAFRTPEGEMPIATHVKNALFHSKALYGKIGNEKVFPLWFEGGLEMPARFGGTCYMSDGTIFKAPTGFSDFMRILVPLKGESTSMIMDQQNVLGDHLGSWNFALSYRPDNWLFKVYFEHQFNDHSQMFGEYSWRDGLAGLQIDLPKNRFVDCFVFEWLKSTDQSGAIYWDSTSSIPEQISAIDDYYNHGVYGGWQYAGMGMGNALFISPVYNTTEQLLFISNRIKAYHLGISGSPLPQLQYRLLISLARHWGTYIQPFEKVMHNNNFMLEMSGEPRKIKGWTFSGAVGLDRSNIIDNNWGISFSVAKRGLMTK